MNAQNSITYLNVDCEKSLLSRRRQSHHWTRAYRLLYLPDIGLLSPPPGRVAAAVAAVLCPTRSDAVSEKYLENSQTFSAEITNFLEDYA